MTSPSIVREAGPDDYHEVWRLIMQGHSEAGIFGLSPKKIEWYVQRMLWPENIHPLDVGPRGVIGVIGQKPLEGLCMLVISELWYSEEKFLEELLVFVCPENRASGHAKALISWMTEQANITGIPLVAGIVSKDRTEAKCKLYRRMMPKAGEFYLVQPKIGVSHNHITHGSSVATIGVSAGSA
jgi:hypothetical protein